MNDLKKKLYDFKDLFSYLPRIILPAAGPSHKVFCVTFIALIANTLSPAFAQSSPSAGTAITSVEKEAIRNALRQKVSDPESARFRWLPRKGTKGTGLTYCGFVNAKNRFGGYVGFAPYLAAVDKSPKGAFAAIIGIGDTDDKKAIVAKLCAENGIDLSGPTTEDLPVSR